MGNVATFFSRSRENVIKGCIHAWETCKSSEMNLGPGPLATQASVDPLCCSVSISWKEPAQQMSESPKHGQIYFADSEDAF